MQDVVFIKESGTVVMKKKLWHETELFLAKIFNFETDIESGKVTANLSVTSKQSLYEFIRIGFKSFSEALAHEEYRNQFFLDVDEFYTRRNGYIDSVIKENLPYHELMYRHQRDVLHESFFKKHNFYALDMGTGKTLTSASLSRLLQIPRTVIICPSAVKWNWFKDLTNKFGFNQLYFTMLDATKRRTFIAFQERFIIINYDILDKWEKHLSSVPVGHFILDEAQNLKNHNSNRAKHVTALVNKFPEAKVTFLSGTPIANRVNDVFSYLKIVGNELGKNHKKFLDDFTIRASGRGVERVTGGKNLQDLHLKLSNFMIRKTKADCLDLPGKIYLSYKFELDDYRDEYNKIIKEMSEQKSISSLTGNIHSLNIITSKAKKQGIIDLAETIIEEGRKVVIFGGYKEPMAELEKHFGARCVKIDGSVDSFMRSELVDKFVKDPEVTVFLGNWDAAGVGINLVNASDIIVHNFPLTPAKLYQGLDRCDRIGQVNVVNVHYTFCEESIDEYIYEILVDKEGDINAVIDRGKEVILRENINEILIKKLLKRDDIDFTNYFSKNDGKAAGEEAVKAEEQEVPPVQKQDVRDAIDSKPNAVNGEGVLSAGTEVMDRLPISVNEIEGKFDPIRLDRYYLISTEDSLYVYNEIQHHQVKDNPTVDVLFDDVDVIKVISKGRHIQQKSTLDFDAKYTPNPPVDIPVVFKTRLEWSEPRASSPSAQMTKFEQAINEIAIKALTPPPGFM